MFQERLLIFTTKDFHPVRDRTCSLSHKRVAERNKGAVIKKIGGGGIKC